ncbi:piggyBac transposable element-derived protein 2-like [Aphis gossypii]|uniref:piggyBac transposable element-derived protein 2-like n=1 Tax=Aphis gossypii TaxID=80765 RepID=UPI002158B43D|nr:piggyBac transposable element-derived protein 2-like [Aphis gossypii]XP_050065956.1 piggyBac transposable element-derived protein 2-like [Aphis gossypii]XP_050066446.1 piggyBac transposable element-derived protein 2-like [Aphis gossypii]
MNLREKDIAFFLDFDIPSDSDVSFCASDDDEDDLFSEKTIENPPLDENIDELLVTSELINQFHKEIEEELRIYDENIASSSQNEPDEILISPTIININQTHNTPYSYFTQLFTDDIFEHIRVETIRYAIQNGKDSFTLTITELKTYFAINIAMTYLRYPNVRMYWSSLPGIRMNLIADAMNVNRFGEIKRFLHFEDNTKKPDSAVPSFDRYWKLRPVITMLHDSFHAAASPDEHIAIDEMIIPFKGRSGLKQYMKAKPKKIGASKFGYKQTEMVM